MIREENKITKIVFSKRFNEQCLLSGVKGLILDTISVFEEGRKEEIPFIITKIKEDIYRINPLVWSGGEFLLYATQVVTATEIKLTPKDYYMIYKEVNTGETFITITSDESQA